MSQRVRERAFLALCGGTAVVISALNYSALGMDGLLPYYQDYRNVIASGFDLARGTLGHPTFPMWGYGWLLLLTDSKPVLLILQNCLGLLAVWMLFRHLRDRERWTVPAPLLLTVGVLLTVPWFALHSVRWPNSIAASLLLFSILLFVQALRVRSAVNPRLIASAICFGMLLNFRSDYYLLPLAMAAVPPVLLPEGRRLVSALLVWVVLVYAALGPWALYTRHATGEFLINSTNSGHVLFIGLGNLPDNAWGITGSDQDPAMNDVLVREFGEPTSSLVLKADHVLKREFRQRVADHPAEFLRKMAHNARATVLGGVYAGEFYEHPRCGSECRASYLARRASVPASLLSTTSSGEDRLRLVAHLISAITGRAVAATSFLLLPLTLVIAIRGRSAIMILALGTISYQAMIQIVGYHMSTYMSAVYLLHIAHIGFCIRWLNQRATQQLQGPPITGSHASLSVNANSPVTERPLNIRAAGAVGQANKGIL
jgi:hypothetical protein